jgi:hypothetical protein
MAAALLWCRNNHFNTMLKHQDGLYILVTDQVIGEVEKPGCTHGPPCIYCCWRHGCSELPDVPHASLGAAGGAMAGSSGGWT